MTWTSWLVVSPGQFCPSECSICLIGDTVKLDPRLFSWRKQRGLVLKEVS